jgi:hypothetical protein
MQVVLNKKDKEELVIRLRGMGTSDKIIFFFFKS